MCSVALAPTRHGTLLPCKALNGSTSTATFDPGLLRAQRAALRHIATVVAGRFTYIPSTYGAQSCFEVCPSEVWREVLDEAGDWHRVFERDEAGCDKQSRWRAFLHTIFTRSTSMRIRVMLMAAFLSVSSATYAEPLRCSLTGYKALPGLVASVADDTLTVTWDGVQNTELRIRFTTNDGTPTIRELAIRRQGAQWRTLATMMTPEFRVASGLRRVSQQQIGKASVAALGGQITREVYDRIKWESFWDAPLYMEGSGERPRTHSNAIPPIEGIPGLQPGLPRSPDEVTRATATYKVQSCEVKTNGARLEILFPGVQLGVFNGRLQYDVYRGTNLIRQAVFATTDRASVAYKYDAGLRGLPSQPKARMVWHDLRNNTLHKYMSGGPAMDRPVTVYSNNRLIVAELEGGSIAAFPPPHTYYWARQSEKHLGASWYRKDSETSFSFGMRQNENEVDPEFYHNFALYSARPGTWQQMPVFFYISPDAAPAALESAAAFTNSDRYKPLPGYKVMGTHYHLSFVSRLRSLGSMDARVNNLDLMRAAGINIYGAIDGAGSGPFAARGPGGEDEQRGGARGRSPEDTLRALADYYEAARRHSDKDFLFMPSVENLPVNLGGHLDMLVSKPTFWLQGRAEGQSLTERHPTYGSVYRLGSPADVMEMTERENALIFMPHPRSKGSTGFPDAIKDTAHFKHQNYRGMGYRWGMGIDGSETRLCEYRCLSLWDEVNNWHADLPGPPKYQLAITEPHSDISDARNVYPPNDDVYGMAPVNYVKLDELPSVDDMSPLINALKRGDYFVTSGEVLIPTYSVQGTGSQRTITAEVEWTFPLDFVEVVWGDGKTTDRQVISAADLPAFGKKRFQIPFNAAGKKWVRFAAWDVARNGAIVQPIKLEGSPAP